MKDVKSDGSLGDETEKGVVFLDLSALKIRPAHFRAMHVFVSVCVCVYFY